ncbi:hypothetical protein F511_21383 [Dorcoceras hygrometricum]|uniref:Uncharacterized protein n=1 Tax=Dorcoceras hygrometricum TaxID=472368 RepID=A0A2Z7DEF7_9LAMI|nr:hypothetical protein F511_21383 [Dorcoceras hygrometricum]
MQIDSDLVIYRTTLLRTGVGIGYTRVFDLQDVCIAIGSLATLDLPMVVDLIGIYGLKGPYCTLTKTDWFLQAPSVIPRGSWGDVSRRFTMIRWAVLLVQADEGISVLVVDRIGDIYRSLPRRADVIVTTGGARHKCQQESHGDAAHGGAPPRALRASDRAPDARRSAEAATSFAHGLRGDAPLIARHWSHDAGRSLACCLCARRAEAMRCSAARNATPCNLLRCWMRDAAGLLLRIIVRCAAPTPPTARRLCDAGSLMCARPCARVRSCGARDLFGGGRRPAAAPASLRRCRDGWSDFF